jgi:FkbM family methyltransferase
MIPGWLKSLIPDAVKSPLRRARKGIRSFRRGGGKFVSCSVRSVRVDLLVTSEIEQYRADTYATKEPDTLDWLDGEFRAGDVLYDIGANVGVYSLYAARKTPGASVYAFEPEAQNFAHLCRNIHRNKLTNIVPVCTPLSDKQAFSRLHVTEMEAGTAFHSLHAPSDQRIGGARSVFEQGALSAPLDVLTSEFGLPEPSLIKLDVDGHEEAIVAGARGLLAKGAVRSLLVEINGELEGPLAGSILTVLNQCGYDLVSSSKGVETGTGETSRNCIFNRRRKPSK